MNRGSEPTDQPSRRRRIPARWLVFLAMAIMAVGFLMIFQPFAKILYTYSFIVILTGTLMFIVVSHFPE